MVASRTITLFALGLAVLVVAGVLLLANRDDDPSRVRPDPGDPQAHVGPVVAPVATAERPPYVGVPPVDFITNKPLPRPAHKLSPYPPGTRIPITHLPKVDQGIPMPDGTFLPFLNGMTHAPPVMRNPIYGPIPRVIAKVVDHGGFEWWLHEDNSATTCRYEQVNVPGGKSYWDPGSAHLTPNEASRMMKEQVPGDRKDGKGGSGPPRN